MRFFFILIERIVFSTLSILTGTALAGIGIVAVYLGYLLSLGFKDDALLYGVALLDLFLMTYTPFSMFFAGVYALLLARLYLSNHLAV